MPRARTAQKVTGKVSPKTNRAISSPIPPYETSSNEMANSPVYPIRSLPRFIWLVPLLIIILAALVWKYKGFIVAATVDNNPIWRLSMDQRLESRYGSTTLDEMINEQIVKNEAAKRGISVSDKDVNDKISQIEKSLAGKISLQEALSQQGMTMTDFRNQVTLQLMVEKLTAQSISVTDSEVASYVAQNKDMLTASDEAGLNQQARQALAQQKQNQAFQKMFQDLKSKAKVTKFF